MTGSFLRKRSLWVIATLVVLFLFPVFLDRFYVYLAAIILLTGLCATSLNFVLGYGGVYQFHHAVFYGAGAYGTALMILKTGLSPWLGFIVGPVVAAMLGFIIGQHNEKADMFAGWGMNTEIMHDVVWNMSHAV